MTNKQQQTIQEMVTSLVHLTQENKKAVREIYKTYQEKVQQIKENKHYSEEGKRSLKEDLNKKVEHEVVKRVGRNLHEFTNLKKEIEVIALENINGRLSQSIDYDDSRTGIYLHEKQKALFELKTLNNSDSFKKLVEKYKHEPAYANDLRNAMMDNLETFDRQELLKVNNEILGAIEQGDSETSLSFEVIRGELDKISPLTELGELSDEKLLEKSGVRLTQQEIEAEYKERFADEIGEQRKAEEEEQNEDSLISTMDKLKEFTAEDTAEDTAEQDEGQEDTTKEETK